MAHPDVFLSRAIQRAFRNAPDSAAETVESSGGECTLEIASTCTDEGASGSFKDSIAPRALDFFIGSECGDGSPAGFDVDEPTDDTQAKQDTTLELSLARLRRCSRQWESDGEPFLWPHRYRRGR